MIKNMEAMKRETEAAMTTNLGAATAVIDNVMLIIALSIDSCAIDAQKIPKQVREMMGWPPLAKNTKKMVVTSLGRGEK
jgi:hypothetical protein